MNIQDLKQIDGILQKRFQKLDKNLDKRFKNLDKRFKNLKDEIKEDMDILEMNIIETVDKHKADKSQVITLEKRVSKIETHFQTS